MLQRSKVLISIYTRHSSLVRYQCIRSLSTTPNMFKKMNNVQKRREESLHRTLEEKRKYYKCKNRYITLEGIPTYSEDVELQDKKRQKTDTAAGKRSVNVMLDKISLYQCDITRLEIDAIANAANNRLLGGGGVDGIIHSAAGHDLYEECLILNGCDTGDAKLSAGYKLPAKYVLHTVGPMGEQPNKLRSCYMRCLDLCKEHDIRSVAFPCISTGIYGYPTDPACKVSLKAVQDWLSDEENFKSIDRVIFCVYLEESLEAYQNFIPQVFNTMPKEVLSTPAEGSSVDPEPCVRRRESVEQKEDTRVTSENGKKPWTFDATQLVEAVFEGGAGGGDESGTKLECPSDEKNHPSVRKADASAAEPMSQAAASQETEEDGATAVIDAEMQSQTQIDDAEMASQTQTDEWIVSTQL